MNLLPSLALAAASVAQTRRRRRAAFAVCLAFGAVVLARAEGIVPRTTWTVRAVDTQETVGENGAAANAFDGNPASYWTSQWFDAKPTLPHQIELDLGATYELSGLTYLPRQDGKTNGRIGQYEFYVSSDGANWGGAVMTGTFANDAAEKVVRFPARSGRYVRLRALTDWSGTNYRTTVAELNLLHEGASPAVSVIPRSGWAVFSFDSQETSAVLASGTTGVARNAIDGNVHTMWHTDVNESTPPPPHHVMIDLGAVRNVSGFRYLPRQDANQKARIADFEFLVSTDGNWGAPVAVGRFANVQAERQVLFTPKQGRFVKLRALSDVTGSLYAAIAELGFLQAASGPNSAPNGAINAPAANATIPAGGSIEFLGSGSDPESDGPLTYRWTFGVGSGVPDSALEDPGFTRFERPGTYTVTLNVADGWGLVDPTPATRTITVRGGQPLSTAGWSVRYVDSQETAAGNYAARNAFDGNPATFWMTAYSSSQPPPPHELQIDLGATYALNGFTYLPRQDGPWDGRVARYEFYVSADGVNWGEPVTGGVFANTPAKKEVFFVTVTARYVRLRALAEITGKPFTSMAELEVLAAAPVVPSVVLLAPRTHDHQRSTDLYVLADANLAAGQGIRFLLDGGAGSGGATVDVYGAPHEAMFENLTRANHRVMAQVIGSGGTAVSGAATRDLASQIGIGDYLVAVGDSITYGIGDDVPADNISRDGRNATAGFPPILQDLLTAAYGRPVAVFNEGIPGEHSVGGADRIAALLVKHPEAQRFLVQYGTNDAGVARASGLGLRPGAAGYAGTFKDYMQRIINAVNAAGKQVVLARIPPVGPINGTYDQRIQNYNRVIAELVADPANRLTAPPDFYGHFSTRLSTHFIRDQVHPNGVGYQSMANLWLNAVRTP